MTPKLLRAYRSTRYEADGISVFVGQRSDAMDALLRRYGARVGAFVTAWNPMSRRMPRGWNDRMQGALLERLRRMAVLPAEGSWRGWQEAHLMVLAAPAYAGVVARLFRQRAVVVAQFGQPLRLRIFRG
jgi:hypothetical protein